MYGRADVARRAAGFSSEFIAFRRAWAEVPSEVNGMGHYVLNVVSFEDKERGASCTVFAGRES